MHVGRMLILISGPCVYAKQRRNVLNCCLRLGQLLPFLFLRRAVPNLDGFSPSESSAGHILEPAKAWPRIRKRAGVEDVRIQHDPRHTLASWLVGAGYNLSLIGRALNNSQIPTTERYAHLSMDSVREALEENADLMSGAQPVSERKKDDE
jgi:integrase